MVSSATSLRSTVLSLELDLERERREAAEKEVTPSNEAALREPPRYLRTRMFAGAPFVQLCRATSIALDFAASRSRMHAPVR